MKRSLVCMMVFLLAGCGGGGDATPPVTPPAGGVDVFTPGNTFSPFSVTINMGGTVNFNITGTPHNVIFSRITGAPADINIVNNVVVSRTFATRGTFPYDCSVHPGMIGQVIVQ